GNIKTIKHKELGALPLILEKQNWQQTTLALGAKTSYYQPVTGYSFPQTLATLEFLLDQFTKKNSQEEITAALTKFLNQKRADSEFLLTLNRMLFLAAKPHRRYIILQRFYKLPESLIHNFYRGQLTLWEKSRILIGKPPVSPISALKAIFFKSTKASSLAQSSK
ncbi:MAG: lycopene cyclase family protein, partial [Bdellovibrionia bacterium]